MDKNTIDISLLKDLDINKVNEFHNSIYKDDRDVSKFVWEFHNAPAGPAIYVIAKDVNTQKIVGTQCAIPIELVTGKGNKILTAKSEDTLVHPDYRGLNIFENMYNLLFDECKKAGIQTIWGFTAARKPFIRLGFETPYSHSQSLMVVNILSSYSYLSGLNPKNTFFSLMKISGLCVLSKINSIKRIFISEKAFQGILLSEDKKLVNDNTFLIQSILDKFPDSFMIDQNSGFMTWRFTENPYPNKLFSISYSKGSEEIANLVFNHHKNGVWYLVQDLYSKNITQIQRVAIFNKAIRLLLASRNNKVKLVRTWDFSHNDYNRQEVAIRKKNGFIHLNRGIYFVWKDLTGTNQLKSENFILSRIASQGVI